MLSVRRACSTALMIQTLLLSLTPVPAFPETSWHEVFDTRGTLGNELEKALTQYTRQCGIPAFETRCSGWFSWGQCHASVLPPKLYELPLSGHIVGEADDDKSALFFLFTEKNINQWKTTQTDNTRYVTALAQHAKVRAKEATSSTTTNCAEATFSALKEQAVGINQIDSATLILNSKNTVTVSTGTFWSPLYEDLNLNGDPSERVSALLSFWKLYLKTPQLASAPSLYYISSFRGALVELEGNPTITRKKLYLFDDADLFRYESVPQPEAVATLIHQVKPSVIESMRNDYVTHGIPISYSLEMPGLDRDFCENQQWTVIPTHIPGTVELAPKAKYLGGRCRFDITFRPDSSVNDYTSTVNVNFAIGSEQKVNNTPITIDAFRQFNPSQGPQFRAPEFQVAAENVLTQGLGNRATISWRLSAKLERNNMNVDTHLPPDSTCVLLCDGVITKTSSCESLWTENGIKITASRDSTYTVGASCSLQVFLLIITNGVPIRRIVQSAGSVESPRRELGPAPPLIDVTSK